jgi:hypothetical protein
MAYDTQNYWVSGVWALSGIQTTGKHNVLGTDPVSETLCFLVFRIPDYGQSPETQ